MHLVNVIFRQKLNELIKEAKKELIFYCTSVTSIEGENGTSILKNGSNYKIPLPQGYTDPII